MASTSLKEDEITEYYDSNEKLHQSAKELADLIRSSKYTVIHTGAGLSTSAGIADFRGPNGVWTLKAKGQKHVALKHCKMPTIAHMAIKKLVDDGLIKYVVSQNIDGLHLKSGIPVNKISELHGNSYKEYCIKCGQVFLRNYRTRTANNVHDHKTGRKCSCNGDLYDSIINFGENLPLDQLKNAEENSKKSDLSIVLGTSMRVSPACNLPLMMKKQSNCNNKLVICNLQKTPYDNEPNAFIIHSKCDDLMQLVMNYLQIEIPDYIFEFNFKVTLNSIKKSVKISESTVKLDELLKELSIVDSKNKKYPLIPGTLISAEKTLLNYNQGNQIGLDFTFNLLNPFKASLKFTQTCKIQVELNCTKNTINYILI